MVSRVEITSSAALAAAEKAGEQVGGDGGGGDIDQVVADQDGGEEFLRLFQQAGQQHGLLVFFLGAVGERDAAEGEQRGFGRGKKGAEQDQQDEKQQGKDQFAGIHGGSSRLFAFVGAASMALQCLLYSW